MNICIKGRGAQTNIENRFQRLNHHPDLNFDPGLDPSNIKTQVFIDSPRSILSRNDSPDIPFDISVNPYQGCEHGCVYCYARNSHEYWGFNAALDFESKIISKPSAPALLRKHFQNKRWKPQKVLMSGNTDCYQPVEKRLRITRELLKVFLEFGNPVGIITKNILVLRDIDLLTELAKENLVQVIFSITSMDEELRRKLEPRSSASFKKFKGISRLRSKGIPVSVMLSPVIPGLNDHEIPAIIRESAHHGATDINMTMIRLNGVIGDVFMDWLRKYYPLKERKIISQIKSLHDGKMNDSRFGLRMTGSGPMAQSIHRLFRTVKSHYFQPAVIPPLETGRFRRNAMQRLF